MKIKLAILIISLCIPLYSFSQYLKEIPKDYWTINKKEFKVGDTLTLTITNKSAKPIYYYANNEFMMIKVNDKYQAIPTVSIDIYHHETLNPNSELVVKKLIEKTGEYILVYKIVLDEPKDNRKSPNKNFKSSLVLNYNFTCN